MKRLSAILSCLLALTLSAFAQPPKATKKSAAPPPPDKAYLQKIWDGWSTLDPANVAKYLCERPARLLRHRSFEIQQLGGI